MQGFELPLQSVVLHLAVHTGVVDEVVASSTTVQGSILDTSGTVASDLHAQTLSWHQNMFCMGVAVAIRVA
jgi:hypothetical protein